MQKKIKIAVLFGGQSSEHEVSRMSANSVLKNIDREKFDIEVIGITREGKWLKYNQDIDKILTDEWESLAVPNNTGSKFVDIDADVVFPVLHGKNGEDGTVQGLLELMGVPYVGCEVLGSAVAMDKGFTKIIFEKAGIPQGKYKVFTRNQITENIGKVIDEIESFFIYPCFIKPCNAGSSVGVSKAHDREELKASLGEALKHDRRVLIEEYINCRELECAVLGNEEPIASCVGEVVASNEFYDYNAKYIDNASKIYIPAQIEEGVSNEIRNYAIKAFKELNCVGLSRVDFFIDKNTGKVLINEINTMPGFTSISMYSKLWEASGISYKELIEKLINLALERNQ